MKKLVLLVSVIVMLLCSCTKTDELSENVWTIKSTYTVDDALYYSSYQQMYQTLVVTTYPDYTEYVLHGNYEDTINYKLIVQFNNNEIVKYDFERLSVWHEYTKFKTNYNTENRLVFQFYNDDVDYTEYVCVKN